LVEGAVLQAAIVKAKAAVATADKIIFCNFIFTISPGSLYVLFRIISLKAKKKLNKL
jgi:hypothetical protein